MPCSTSFSQACCSSGVVCSRPCTSPRSFRPGRLSRPKETVSQPGVGGSGRRARERRGLRSRRSRRDQLRRGTGKPCRWRGRGRPRGVEVLRAAKTGAARRLDSAVAARAQAEAALAESTKRLERLAAAARATRRRLTRLPSAWWQRPRRSWHSQERAHPRRRGGDGSPGRCRGGGSARKALDDRARSLASLRAELAIRSAGLEERSRSSPAGTPRSRGALLGSKRPARMRPGAGRRSRLRASPLDGSPTSSGASLTSSKRPGTDA